ncbi:c-type cytochrome [Fulvivirgaceae bacterium PWU4]|uniref:C-type cytochrome n=1 Tax=Chryseosolibacter histidini TaxID=2782349 RepID=A0AAP2DGZ7_9BACT|nr:cytochrome c [Chryseosolibacter histidini]MBT1696140.1 c-type cytochrome [Chryseosolibacter histidini]
MRNRYTDQPDKTPLYIILLVVLCACKGQPDFNNENISLKDTASWPQSFGFGRLASSHDIDTLDIDIRPDGKGLPYGSGTVSQGKAIYAAKCALCHGKTGTEGPFNPLVTKTDTASSSKEPGKEKTIGNYWPYATTLYDYINRAMPFNTPGSLTPDEVYSLTAFLLHANNIVDSSAVMNAQTLPQVNMPARALFVPDDRSGGTEIK